MNVLDCCGSRGYLHTSPRIVHLIVISSLYNVRSTRFSELYTF